MSSEKKIISIVDDDQDTSKLFHVVLSQAFAGYDVKSFNDSASALQHFTENQSAYAMVITDLRMPGMNGLELLSKIKNANPNTRTVVISGINSDNQMFRECMELGVIDSTIGKPIRIQSLRDRIGSELELYQSENTQKKYEDLPFNPLIRTAMQFSADSVLIDSLVDITHT